jgi:hypothetical protein
VELYTLDPLLRRENVIDRFESCIWTERYKDLGDFELTIYSTRASRTLLKTGTKLAMNESYRVMTVETVENKEDSEGRRVLIVKGRSVEEIMDSRVAMNVLDDLTTNPKWIITNPPATVARKIFHDICVTGILNVGDQIPFIVEGSIMPTSTIPEPIDPITVEIEPTSVYTAIKNICDVWNLGFRILRNFDMSQLYFDIYTGSDRTSAQTTLPAVIFTPELDNLQSTTELTSISLLKNVAYVFSPAGFEEVYALDVDPESVGFERRVLAVNASDITDDNPDVSAALIQRGTEELAQCRTLQAFDGEISQFSQYKYQRDYYLGDIVEQRDGDGNSNYMRVTEQIFVSDGEGERSYPTLEVNQFITTGSWLSWTGNKVWTDYGADEFWEDQP